MTQQPDQRRRSIYTWKAPVVSVESGLVTIAVNLSTMTVLCSERDTEFLMPDDMVTVTVELPGSNDKAGK